MRVVPTTFAHALACLEDLSDQNAAEHAALGLCQLDVLRLIKGFLTEGSAYTGLRGGEPVCIFGVLAPEDGEARTWFLATKAYFSLGASAVIHARRFLRGAYLKHGRLFTGSCSPHPDVDRWFEALGYRKLEEIDGVKWFVYEMTKPSEPARLANGAESSSQSKRYKPEVAAPGSEPGR